MRQPKTTFFRHALIDEMDDQRRNDVKRGGMLSASGYETVANDDDLRRLRVDPHNVLSSRSRTIVVARQNRIMSATCRCRETALVGRLKQDLLLRQADEQTR